jgi:hypothetical protein
MNQSAQDIVVVGSIAFDDIETIKGNKKRLLGGSGTYFSLIVSISSNAMEPTTTIS